jgi:hypothetical protein
MPENFGIRLESIAEWLYNRSIERIPIVDEDLQDHDDTRRFPVDCGVLRNRP